MRTLSRYVHRSGRRLASVVAVVATLAAGGVLAATTPAAAASRTDVYMRDFNHPSYYPYVDYGYQPSTTSPYEPMWKSPDIRVCQTAVMCPWDQWLHYNATNYVFVTMRRPGPYEQQPAQDLAWGTLEVYYADAGAGTTWSVDWHKFYSQYLPVASGVTTFTVPWQVPGFPDGHYCLLARWVSATDPMVFEGPDTALNVRYNNNLAWHNISAFPIIIWQPIHWYTFHIGNVLKASTVNDLTFTEPGQRWEDVGGTVTVDLGADLFNRWRDAGAKGEGIKVVGDTQIQVLDLAKGRISGLPLKAGEAAQIKVGFTAQKAMDTPIAVDVAQIGPGEEDGEPMDLGGVEYLMTPTEK